MSNEKRMNRKYILYIYKMEYDAAIRCDEVLQFIAIWVKMECLHFKQTKPG